MPSKNEIVPLETATTAPSGPEAAAREGPGAVAVLATTPRPSKVGSTVGGAVGGGILGGVKASNAEMASAQERRVLLVAAQRRHTAFQLFYGLFGVALMMVQMEYLWFANTQSLPEACPLDVENKCPRCLEALSESVPVTEGRMILLALRVLISFSTALLLYYVYLYYAAECEVMKLKNIVPPKATLLSSSLRRALLLELSVLSIHPFPGLEAVDPRWPNLVVAFSLLMFTRIALVLRVVQFRNSFNSSNGWFIGALTNVDFTATFFLKSTLKNHPTSCLLASFATLVSVAGYSLFVAERFLCAFSADACCQPMSLADALWTLIITILTIGYGDIVPQTSLGRVLAVGAGLFGTISTAVTIAVMSNYLVLTRSEHKVNAFLKKDENRRLINDQAARALQAFVQLRAAQRRHKQSCVSNPVGDVETIPAEALASPTKSGANCDGGGGGQKALRRAELKLFDVLRKYRQVKRRVNSHDVNDPMDSQMTMLEMMEVNVEYIRTKIEELSELFLTQGGDHARDKRRLSSIMASAAASVSATTAASAVLENSGSVLSSVPTGGTTSLLQQLQHQHQQHQHLALAQHHHQNVRSQHPPTTSTPHTNTSNANHTTPGPQTSSTTDTQSAEAPPAWALVLEQSLHSLLQQVAHVSDEVEAVKMRVQMHAESMESRVLELEKRLVVGDALREVSKSRSSRALLRRDSNASADGATGGVSAPRLRRPSTNLHRPSIHKFVSSRDLLEYNKPGDQHDHGHG